MSVNSKGLTGWSGIDLCLYLENSVRYDAFSYLFKLSLKTFIVQPFVSLI